MADVVVSKSISSCVFAKNDDTYVGVSTRRLGQLPYYIDDFGARGICHVIFRVPTHYTKNCVHTVSDETTAIESSFVPQRVNTVHYFSVTSGAVP